jgi:hypothetical protein
MYNRRIRPIFSSIYSKKGSEIGLGNETFLWKAVRALATGNGR